MYIYIYTVISVVSRSNSAECSIASSVRLTARLSSHRTRTILDRCQSSLNYLHHFKSKHNYFNILLRSVLLVRVISRVYSVMRCHPDGSVITHDLLI